MFAPIGVNNLCGRRGFLTLPVNAIEKFAPSSFSSVSQVIDSNAQKLSIKMERPSLFNSSLVKEPFVIYERSMNADCAVSHDSDAFGDFQKRFQLLAQKHPKLIINTLSNIFTMRLIGNKTHGDLAEIGMAEFIHQFMYDYDSIHVGKDLFRAKEHEEDIVIINELNQQKIPVSLKAYGDGPLQLSTDKDSLLFPKLKEYGNEIIGEKIQELFSSEAFAGLNTVNVMPLIYREKQMQCNIMVFDFEKMRQQTQKIVLLTEGDKYDNGSKSIIRGKGRKHPIYMFLDHNGEYICEVRYGNATANALQRGFWTHTQHASSYFNSLTNGWISYSHNETLVKLFRLALNSTENGHKLANDILQKDIDNLFQNV